MRIEGAENDLSGKRALVIEKGGGGGGGGKKIGSRRARTDK